jgi:hypothetical protein
MGISRHLRRQSPRESQAAVGGREGGCPAVGQGCPREKSLAELGAAPDALIHVCAAADNSSIQTRQPEIELPSHDGGDWPRRKGDGATVDSASRRRGRASTANSLPKSTLSSLGSPGDGHARRIGDRWDCPPLTRICSHLSGHVEPGDVVPSLAEGRDAEGRNLGADASRG